MPTDAALDHAAFLEVEAEVRYWEDAVVNGVVDSNGDLIPGRHGDLWRILIDLSPGRIESWPSGVEARIHYKVCDAGEYWLCDRDRRRIARWRGAYVPAAFLCHGRPPHSDYIMMEVTGEGTIPDYRRPGVDPDQWEPILS